jgi:CheY-like chemotaxis protein
MADRDKLRIVVVDDNRLVLSQYARFCAGVAGVEVVGQAQSGAEAIRQVKLQSPDLVLMDLIMPDIDGMTALRMMSKGLPGIRVIVVSSLGGSTKTAEEAFKLGAVDVLTKPVQPEVLIRTLQSELERKRKGAGP